MKFSHRFLKMVENSLQTQEVSAIGLKLFGEDGSDFAEGILMSCHSQLGFLG